MNIILGVLLICASLYTGNEIQRIETDLSNSKVGQNRYISEIKDWSELIGIWTKNYTLWPDQKYLDAIGYAENQINYNGNSFNKYNNKMQYLISKKAKYQTITITSGCLGLYILIKEVIKYKQLDNMSYNGHNLVYNIKF